MKHPTLAEWLASEPFTLSLSSGFFAFFAHLGMLQALLDRGLTPARVSGSSAGALTGTLWAAGVPPETLHHTLAGLDRTAFWDPSPGIGLLRGQALRKRLYDLLPITDLSQSPVPVAISAWSGGTQVFRQGPAAECIYASCAVPLLFQPATINGRWFWDGGIADRHGLAGTAANERVMYHHIASRSPWRRQQSPALRIPQRDGLASLALQGLPRSGPGRLDQGREALALAQRLTTQALDRPLPGHDGGHLVEG